jgi:hypothetical protein
VTHAQRALLLEGHIESIREDVRVALDRVCETGSSDDIAALDRTLDRLGRLENVLCNLPHIEAQHAAPDPPALSLCAPPKT